MVILEHNRHVAPTVGSECFPNSQEFSNAWSALWQYNYGTKLPKQENIKSGVNSKKIWRKEPTNLLWLHLRIGKIRKTWCKVHSRFFDHLVENVLRVEWDKMDLGSMNNLSSLILPRESSRRFILLLETLYPFLSQANYRQTRFYWKERWVTLKPRFLFPYCLDAGLVSNVMMAVSMP